LEKSSQKVAIDAQEVMDINIKYIHVMTTTHESLCDSSSTTNHALVTTSGDGKLCLNLNNLILPNNHDILIERVKKELREAEPIIIVDVSWNDLGDADLCFIQDLVELCPKGVKVVMTMNCFLANSVKAKSAMERIINHCGIIFVDDLLKDSLEKGGVSHENVHVEGE
jgi:hypothetical protein